ncbi:MAG: energy-coupling factor ABC transporter ATP-binding protein [Dehalococcoidia bacterium]|nr:energy-coupling factor ABC transporter ATP-binding protein [Dehalococcoidia bacterium]
MLPPQDASGIHFRNVSFAYANGEPVLRSVDLEVRPAEVVALLGTNGSGKSTICRLACGLLAPSEGRVSIDGAPMAGVHWSTIQHVPQHPDEAIAWPLVFDDVAFAPRNRGLPEREVRAAVQEALESVGLRGFEDREVGTLSTGERQRLVLAGALSARPRYLVLDEPSAHLDPIAGWRILRSVASLAASRGIGVLLVTHRADALALCHRAAVLADGCIVREGRAREIAADPAWLRARGIDPPPAVQLGEALRRHKVPLPALPLHLEELVACLTRP